MIDFAKFWSLYPKRVGKQACQRKWVRLSYAEQQGIIEDLKARRGRDKQWVNGYIPNPLTYLNQGRWEDEWESVDHEDTSWTIDPETGRSGQ